MRLLRWLLSPFLAVSEEKNSFAEATTKKSAHGTTDQWHADGPVDTGLRAADDTTRKMPVLPREESGKGDQP